MVSIVRATQNDHSLLSSIATLTFIESHGASAPPGDITNYVAKKYSNEILKEELSDPKNIYHILYNDSEAIGYSKIILNYPFDNLIQNITKLERIYLLKRFYHLKLGAALFQFNVDFIKAHAQMGMWLFVWKENERAINFYKRNGFVIIGSYDFPISETHSNPNHQMLLRF